MLFAAATLLALSAGFVLSAPQTQNTQEALENDIRDVTRAGMENLGNYQEVFDQLASQFDNPQMNFDDFLQTFQEQGFTEQGAQKFLDSLSPSNKKAASTDVKQQRKREADTEEAVSGSQAESNSQVSEEVKKAFAVLLKYIEQQAAQQSAQVQESYAE